MVKLFTMVNGEFVPTDECLNTYPFDEIWARDTHVKKDLAKRELSYIAYLTTPTEENPFYGYPWQHNGQDTTRSDKIIENKFKEYPDWEPDGLVIACVEQQQEFFYKASPKLSLYEASLIGAKKTEEFLRNFDMGALNPKSGVPLYTIKGITDGLKNIEEVLTKLDATGKKVYQDIYDITKTKGNKAINKFEE